MSKCLVTRLQGVVSDDTLPKFGIAIVRIPVGDELVRRVGEKLYHWFPLYLNCIDGVYFTDVSDTDHITEFDGEVYPNPKTVLTGEEPGTIEWDYYRSGVIAGVFNVSQIASYSIEAIRPTKYGPDEILGYTTSYGSTEGIATKVPNLKCFECEWNNQVSGNIMDFAPLLEMVYISVRTTRKFRGDVKDFAEAQVAAGRTSGSISIICNASLTNNGTVVGNGIVVDITFSPELENGYSITVS